MKQTTIGKKIFLMLLGIISTTLLTGFLYFFTFTGQFEELFKTTYDPFSINGSNNGNETIKASKPLTILLLGVDTGSGSREEEWVGNSDTMILLTINPKTKKTTMMSLERDILTNLYNEKNQVSGSQAKLNAAYQEGEVAGAIATIQNLMNVTVDHYVMVNMKGMVDLVDAVDGITVNNELGFPISIEDQEPEYTATIDPGKQQLNGEQALVYARMRYQDPQGDYGRQKRQREVIGKIVKKVLSMDSLSRYQDILKAVSSNMKTSIELNRDTMQQLLGYQEALKNIKTYQLTGVDAMFDGASYQVVTKEHLLEMQNIIQASLDKEAYEELQTSAILYEDIYGVTAETPDYTGDSTVGSSGTTDAGTGTETGGETAIPSDGTYNNNYDNNYYYSY